MHVRRLATATCVLAVWLTACSTPTTAPGPSTPSPTPPASTPPAPTPPAATPSAPTPPAPTSPSPTAPAATAAPAWLGTRVLEAGPTGFPPPQPTPPELFPRRIATSSPLPPPPDDTFTSHVQAVPEAVAVRSTWQPECPVGLDDLRYVTVAHWGFDGRPHTGELLVHEEVVQDVVAVFARLHELRFPLESVRVTSPEELAAPPTGDGNGTSAFVCRPTVGSTSWSAHAYGRAIDVNPFQNPYRRETDAGPVVLPELATAYLDRSLDLPGMVHADGPVVAAFDDVGWTWGGDFATISDLHHFSSTGR